METGNNSSRPRPVLTQDVNNTTLWIGHLQTDPTDHFAGQTFKCPTEGRLDNIQVYSSAVHTPGEMSLTVHEFDNDTKNWGPSIAHSSLHLERGDDSKWIRFSLNPVTLRKDVTYGFRLQANDAFVAIGEGVSDTQNPFTFGNEWNADSTNQQGHYFTYFSLAFKVELCA